MSLYSETGEFVFNASFVGGGENTINIPKDGDYFLSISDGSGFYFLSDLFDLNSATSFRDLFGFAPDLTEGPYFLSLSLNADRLIRFVAMPGDVISAAVTDASGRSDIALRDPDGITRMPRSTPLPEPSEDADYAVGDAEVAVVADKFGVWVAHATFAEATDFEIQVKADAPPLGDWRAGDATQIVYLDFDGQQDVDMSRFLDLPVEERGPRNFSSIDAAFNLLRLDEERYDEFLDAIIANVQKRLVDDLAAQMINPRFNIDIRNSRDHGALWGQKNVTRVIVTGDDNGGEGNVFGTGLRGLAESVDIGNFTTEETSLVFAHSILDRLFVFGPNEDARLIAAANRVGFIIAHELGHLFGAFHVREDPAAIMKPDVSSLDDRGDDGVEGTSDDVLNGFSAGRIADGFAPSFQDSRSTISWGNGSSNPILRSFSRSFGYTLMSNGKNTTVETFGNAR